MSIREHAVRRWNEWYGNKDRTILGAFTIKEFMEAYVYSTENQKPLILGGYKLTKTNKLKAIYHKGTRCDVCGLQGELFLITRHGTQIHINLCSMVPVKSKKKKPGHALPWIHMTIDHTIPRFLPEGKDTSANTQILCSKCNNEWKNQIDREYWTDEVRKKFFGL